MRACLPATSPWCHSPPGRSPSHQWSPALPCAPCSSSSECRHRSRSARSPQADPLQAPAAAARQLTARQNGSSGMVRRHEEGGRQAASTRHSGRKQSAGFASAVSIPPGGWSGSPLAVHSCPSHTSAPLCRPRAHSSMLNKKRAPRGGGGGGARCCRGSAASFSSLTPETPPAPSDRQPRSS